MAELFASGWIIDAILLLMALETAVLVMYRRAAGRGPDAFAIVANVVAGGAVMVAVRIALTGGWWGWIAALLFASLIGHAADVYRRWAA